MAVLTEAQARERVARSDSNTAYILRPKKQVSPNRGQHGLQGRKTGDTNLSEFAREIIGTAAHFDKRSNVVREFGVSPASVNNYKNGELAHIQTETGEILDKVSKDLKKGIRKRLDDITDLATEKILKTLNCLTDEKIETVQKVTDLTVIAKNLASIVEKANPKDQGNGNSVQVNLFVPGQSKEADFESINVVYNPLEER